MELKNKTAVITGGASGIGLGVAQVMLGRGMNVVLIDRDEKALADVLEMLNKTYDGHVMTYVADVTVPEQLDAAREAAIARFGSVEVLHNNAGVAIYGRVWGHDAYEWDWMWKINVQGVVNGLHAFVPYFLERGIGHVVNTASVSGFVVGPHLGAYAATKNAIITITEALAMDFDHIGANIGVTCYCPTWVKTNIMKNTAANAPARSATNCASDELVEKGTSQAFKSNANGLDPLIAGELVVSAIEQGKFWVFNDTGDTFERIKGRINSVLTNEYPSLMRGDVHLSNGKAPSKEGTKDA